MDVFLIRDDGLFKKYNNIRDKVDADNKNNVKVKLPTLKNFWKPK